MPLERDKLWISVARKTPEFNAPRVVGLTDDKKTDDGKTDDGKTDDGKTDDEKAAG